VWAIDDAVLHKLRERVRVGEDHAAPGAVIQPVDDHEPPRFARMHSDALEVIGMAMRTVEVMDEVLGLHDLYINTGKRKRAEAS
jgi:hypothetical protein